MTPLRATLPVVVALAAACGDDGGGGDGGPVVEPGDPGAADVALDVRTDTARREISPLVYGINGEVDTARDRPGLVRAGGNRLTAYNWENNASNAGADYCHQNDGLIAGAGSPPGQAFAALLADADARGTGAIVTVPIVDHVAADHDDLGDAGQGPPACVGDVANSGGDYLDTRFVANVARKGAAFADPPDLGDGAVYQDELVAWVRARAGDARVLVSLDNEPDLWADTHPRIHPDPVTYAELVERTVRFAAAVKDAWPAVEVLGFVSYGYAGYLSLQDAPDAAAHGEFVSYFLGELAAAEAAAGRRLVDYLDLHWYPEARGDGVRISDVSDGTGAAARVQAPRSLWDPTYQEDSWIAGDVVGGPIALIPWLSERIDAHYPGTRLAFTEWNYGGGGHISGAIATADVLGVLGREGVGAAAIWRLHADERYTLAGLRAYTSYDGAGARFGATSIAATTSDVERVTVYGSDDGGGRVVIVAINKGGADLTAGLRVAAPATYTRARRWVLTGDAPELVEAAAAEAAATNAFRVPLPAWSVSVIVPE